MTRLQHVEGPDEHIAFPTLHDLLASAFTFIKVNLDKSRK